MPDATRFWSNLVAAVSELIIDWLREDPTPPPKPPLPK